VLHTVPDQRRRQRPRHHARPAAAHQNEAEENARGGNSNQEGRSRQTVTQTAQAVAQLAAGLRRPEFGSVYR
jgi:hypothetical protein